MDAWNLLEVERQELIKASGDAFILNINGLDEAEIARRIGMSTDEIAEKTEAVVRQQYELGKKIEKNVNRQNMVVTNLIDMDLPLEEQLRDVDLLTEENLVSSLQELFRAYGRPPNYNFRSVKEERQIDALLNSLPGFRLPSMGRIGREIEDSANFISRSFRSDLTGDVPRPRDATEAAPWVEWGHQLADRKYPRTEMYVRAARRADVETELKDLRQQLWDRENVLTYPDLDLTTVHEVKAQIVDIQSKIEGKSALWDELDDYIRRGDHYHSNINKVVNATAFSAASGTARGLGEYIKEKTP
jgi:hypothetical protein